MARIPPVDETSAPPASRELAAAHAATGGRMTNMKWTLAHSPVALDALLQWYPLHDEVAPVLGERRTWLFCHAISTQSDCLICSTFFRRLLIDAGEDPDDAGAGRVRRADRRPRAPAGRDPHTVDDALHARLAERLTPPQIVTLIAFGAIMVATNVFNDALGRRARRLPAPVRRMSVALITGAAHGQGRATALALAGDGYDIVALDVAAPLTYPPYPMGSTEELDSLRAEVEALGRACLTVVADVRDDAAVAAAVHDAIDRFGRIDVLFNNAGICAYGLAHELTEAEWDAMLDINLKGAWIVARHVIPHMIEAKSGVIVNNSSIAGLRGMGRLSHYAASASGA